MLKDARASSRRCVTLVSHSAGERAFRSAAPRHAVIRHLPGSSGTTGKSLEWIGFRTARSGVASLRTLGTPVASHRVFALVDRSSAPSPRGS